jgi:hypothetical protein
MYNLLYTTGRLYYGNLMWSDFARGQTEHWFSNGLAQ